MYVRLSLHLARALNGLVTFLTSLIPPVTRSNFAPHELNAYLHTGGISAHVCARPVVLQLLVHRATV